MDFGKFLLNMIADSDDEGHQILVDFSILDLDLEIDASVSFQVFCYLMSHSLLTMGDRSLELYFRGVVFGLLDAIAK